MIGQAFFALTAAEEIPLPGWPGLATWTSHPVGFSPFEREKEMQRHLWDHWRHLSHLPFPGFLSHIELRQREWSSNGGGRVDFLAYDHRLASPVVIELKNHTLNCDAVRQVVGYIEPATKTLGCPTYGVLIGPSVTPYALATFYAEAQPLRLALTVPWDGLFDGGIALAYLCNVYDDYPFLPDGNPAMADFVADRVRSIVHTLENWESEEDQ